MQNECPNNGGNHHHYYYQNPSDIGNEFSLLQSMHIAKVSLGGIDQTHHTYHRNQITGPDGYGVPFEKSEAGTDESQRRSEPGKIGTFIGQMVPRCGALVLQHGAVNQE